MRNLTLFVILLIAVQTFLQAEVPIDISINIISDEIIITWTDSGNSNLFYIYRSTSPYGNFTKIDSVTTNSFSESLPVNGTNFFYYVTASEEMTITDIDGNIYNTVQIGDQIWMAENLKVTHYRNGEPITQISDNNNWAGVSTGAYCYYNNSASNGDTYGALYNWYAVNDGRNIAPEGWHLPTDEELTELENFLGSSAGSKLAGREDLWTDGTLENDPFFGISGFCLLPGGFRSGSTGNFSYVGNYATLWSSTEDNINNAWGRYLNYYSTIVGRSNYNKHYGFSVRCVKD